MKGAIKVVEDWCMSTGLTVNASKTEAIIFTRRYKVDRRRPLTMFGTELKEASEVKYLGVILDSKLSWAAHMDRVYKRFTTSWGGCGSQMDTDP